MDVQLGYRNTFIDVLEQPQEEPCRRASSCPPLRDETRIEVLQQQQDVNTRCYVAGLLDKAGSVRARGPEPEASNPPPELDGDVGTRDDTGYDYETASELEERPMQTPQRMETNPGSRGHPNLCRRPCVRMVRSRFCEMDAECDYCHMPHETRSKLDSRHRKFCQTMPKAEFLNLMENLIQQKAEDVQSCDLKAILGVLREEIEDPDPVSSGAEEAVHMKAAAKKKFAKVMSNLNLSALMSFTCLRCSVERKSSILRLLDVMRANAALSAETL